MSLPCQLLFAERQLDSVVLDLVARERVDVDGRTLEAGAPMALALRFDPAFSDNVEPGGLAGLSRTEKSEEGSKIES